MLRIIEAVLAATPALAATSMRRTRMPLQETLPGLPAQGSEAYFKENIAYAFVVSGDSVSPVDTVVTKTGDSSSPDGKSW